jgi:hypothetical protein
MKKIIFFLLTALFFAQTATAGEFIKISSVESAVSIKNPTGDTLMYKSLDKLPGLAYGSRINAVGGRTTIKVFNAAEVVLEKDQGIFITKNPITKAVEMKKRESKNQKSVKVILAGRAHAYFGADTVVAITERYPSVYFEVVTGRAIIRSAEGKMREIAAGDLYEAKKSLLD